jgi:hypothetical protein
LSHRGGQGEVGAGRRPEGMKANTAGGKTDKSLISSQIVADLSPLLLAVKPCPGYHRGGRRDAAE